MIDMSPVSRKRSVKKAGIRRTAIRLGKEFLVADTAELRAHEAAYKTIATAATANKISRGVPIGIRASAKASVMRGFAKAGEKTYPALYVTLHPDKPNRSTFVAVSIGGKVRYVIIE